MTLVNDMQARPEGNTQFQAVSIVKVFQNQQLIIKLALIVVVKSLL